MLAESNTGEERLNGRNSTSADDGDKPDCAGGKTFGKKLGEQIKKQKTRIGTWKIRTINNGSLEAMTSLNVMASIS